ncbi:Tar ligand binding domain-containing protein [Burkholderia guangdongensis]|uniref:Tar ligand binding domain-containing protein n=1 Tax=Burkholderia guangdongensis TaxID=1792500 RepID=UPI0015CE6FFA|nr:Tar ligand binding domain-containing protein [Burkholderia guangdongensis]
MTIRTRAIAVGFRGLLLLCRGAIGVLGSYQSTVAQKAMYESHLTSSIAFARADASFSHGYLVLRHVALAPDEPGGEEEIRRAQLMFDESDNTWKSYTSITSSNEENRLAQAVDIKRVAFSDRGYRQSRSAWSAGQKDKFTAIVSVQSPTLAFRKADEWISMCWHPRSTHSSLKVRVSRFSALIFGGGRSMSLSRVLR